MKNFSQVIQTINENKKDIELLPTGLLQIDSHLEGGFLKKELVVLGGATGKGKSLFGGTIFYNIASAGFKSAYFSLEISNEMIVSRLLGAHSNLSPTKIMIKMLEEQEQTQVEESEAKLSVNEQFMTFYDDLYELGKIIKEIKEHNYDFVVIDFIQNIMTTQNDEYERLSQIALSLQKLAKETNTCILALSQLSNQMSKSKDESLVEYKGSGSIGTVCDLGFFIEKGDGLDFGDTITLNLRLRKNRRGISGSLYKFILKQPGGMIHDI